MATIPIVKIKAKIFELTKADLMAKFSFPFKKEAEKNSIYFIPSVAKEMIWKVKTSTITKIERIVKKGFILNI